jgi:hypothetical protein
MAQDQMNGSDESNRGPRQGDARRRGSGQLDEIGRKRLNFLHRHQSKSVQRPGRDPLPEERRFEFQEE